MGDQGTNAVVALLLGSVVAVLLFIPVAAVQYRRDGRLGPGDLAVLVGAAVYGVALWTYTLLPLPDVGDYACQHAQTRLMAFADDIRRAAEQAGYGGLGTPGELLRNQAFLQVVLNVVLFLPFGPFVRLITHRGVAVATGLGLAVSLLIEVTQLTGVWGVYPCAYRLFDVDDLLTNTLGAFLGAVVSYPYAARRHRRLGTARRALPATVSVGRRLAATVSDVLFVVLGGTAAAALWRGYGVFVLDEHPATDSGSMVALRAGVPFLVEALMVLIAGKTLGELVVDLRTTPASYARRLVKLLTGVAPLVVLAVVTVTAAQVVLGVLAVASGAGAYLTRRHRGLSNAVAGLELEIDDG
ncbi:VanZ family protein [Nocardioides agariphilus]|uniref:VanZ family protein n=1 Tax=Nocardioides agariphilus TaxID=433664 RepID=A0A930YPR5_9ACTN|nr:VanZ family protein [Nocardioides agariphilus]